MAPFDRRSEPYQEIVRENEKFETYYKHEKVCPEDQYDKFITALKANLPVSCFCNFYPFDIDASDMEIRSIDIN